MVNSLMLVVGVGVLTPSKKKELESVTRCFIQNPTRYLFDKIAAFCPIIAPLSMIMRGKVTPMFDFLNPTESKTLALNWVGFVEEENKRIEKEGNKLIACRGCTNAVLIRKGHTGDILCEDCLDLPTPSAN